MSYGPHTHNPYEHDETPPEDETSPCGCGDSRCRIDGNDETNIQVQGKWFSADCVGYCTLCRELDDVKQLIRIAGFWLAHNECAKNDVALAADLERQARNDEDRDDFNLVRR